MARSPSGQNGSRTVELKRRGRHSPSDRRREAQRLAKRIEDASRDRRNARAEGCRDDAHELDVELHGTDAGAPKSRGEEAYRASHGGLYEECRAARAVGGER
jgi:hypothetical protein